MKKKTKQLIDCFRDGPSGLVFWSFRYFVGRRTIATCCFAQDLARAWPLLDVRTQELIKRDLDEAFRHDDECRSAGEDYRPLGDDCDRASWEKVRAMWMSGGNNENTAD